MESHQWDPQAALVCPYDPLHVVSAKRFQRHIIKCRKNHPDLDFVACPYDARHMLHRSALKQHIAQCPERKPLDADIKQEKDDETGETYRLKGNTSLPTSRYRREIYDDEEDWEPEIQENIARKEEQQQRILRESKPRLREPHFSFDENVVACNRPSRKLPEPGLLSSNRIDGYCSDESETSISSKCSSLYVEPIKNNPRDKIANGNLVNVTLPPRPAGRGMLALLHSTNVDRPTGRGSAHVMLKESIRKPFGIGRGSVKQAAIKTS